MRTNRSRKSDSESDSESESDSKHGRWADERGGRRRRAGNDGKVIRSNFHCHSNDNARRQRVGNDGGMSCKTERTGTAMPMVRTSTSTMTRVMRKRMRMVRTRTSTRKVMKAQKPIATKSRSSKCSRSSSKQSSKLRMT